MPTVPALPHRLDKTLGIALVQGETHAGLAWVRWPLCWADDNGNPWTPAAVFAPSVDKRAISDFAGWWKPNARGLARMQDRLDALVQAHKGRALEVKTTSRLAIGTGGKAHPFETGFTFDPALGQPVLPGSSLKGLARAYATLTGEDPARAAWLFGIGPEDEGQERAGAIVFLDAWPQAAGLSLEVDILNPHEPGYYRALEDGGSPHLPLGTDNPIPVNFLTVKAGATYCLRLLPRDAGVEEEDLADAMDILREALEALGIGAKTAAGYGRMWDPSWRPPEAQPAAEAAPQPAHSPQPAPSVLPARSWRFAWINATQDPPRNNARLMVRQVTTGPELPQANLSPTVLFSYNDVGKGKVQWADVTRRLDTLLVGSIPADGWTDDGPLLFVCGIGPVPIFLRLGARLGRFAAGHLHIIHPQPGKAPLRFDPSTGATPFFAEPVISSLIDDPTLPIVLSVFTLPEPPLPAAFAPVAPKGLAALVHLGPASGTRQDFLPQHAAHALGAVEDAARQARNRWPQASRLLVVVNGPSALGVIAGMAVNPSLGPNVEYPAFAEGKYLAAMDAIKL